MRIIYQLLICLMTSTLLTSARANLTEIDGVRIWSAPDSTRVVFDLKAPVTHSLNHLTDPYRLVIDIEDSQTSFPLSQPTANDKYLQRLRGATRNDDDLRIVLDLKKFSRSKSFQLAPNTKYGHRLVVDIFDSEAEQQEEVESIETQAVSNSVRDIVIAIDAGHGGEDPGASGPKGTYEKNVTLAMAQVLVDLINQERGMKAVLTREGDYFLRLRKRIAIARQHKADMFISLHADAFRDPSVHGSSVYVLSKSGASSEHAKWLAEQENSADLIGGVSLDNRDDVLASVLLDLSQTASLEASIDMAGNVLSGLKSVGKLHKKRVESAGFAVLKSPDIPSILIETAYISNPQEEKNLLNPSHRHKLAKAVLNGLRKYFYENAPENTLLASKKHTITRGDTLSQIAQQYKVSVKSIRTVNGLTTDMVRAGQTITIPSSGS
jgi:N-acetylmuramoyl-L-alanine amidase